MFPISQEQRATSLMKDIAKLRADTRGGHGPELVEKYRQLNEIAQNMSPGELCILRDQALKEVVHDTGKQNDLKRSKGQKPIYDQSQIAV